MSEIRKEHHLILRLPLVSSLLGKAGESKGDYYPGGVEVIYEQLITFK